jgi:hypothetical protein
MMETLVSTLLKAIVDVLYIMSSNLQAGSMHQSHGRNNNIGQNHLLMNISSKKCCPLGLPSQQGADKKPSQQGAEKSKVLIKKDMREVEIVNKLQSMVVKNYQQHVGLVSSGQRKTVGSYVWLHFPLFSQID